MKVGFSTPNVAGAGPVAQSAILTPANSVNGNAVNGSVLLSSGVPTLPQTTAPTAGPTPSAGSTSSGGLTPMARVSTSASGSGSSFVPLADAPATAMKVPDSGLGRTAVQSAASAMLAGQKTVLAALLALKGAQPMSSTRLSVGGAGFVPAATLPSGLLLLLKDTVMPTVLTQATQRSGEVRNAIPSPVLQSPPSLPQQLVNVPSALKSALPNPLGPQSAVKTPENLAARKSASPYAFQHGQATSGEMSAQHHQAGVGLKSDSAIVSTRYASNMIPMEANLRPTAAMLGPDRQADSPVGSKAALSLSARLSRQSEQIRTQTLQASSISDTRYFFCFCCHGSWIRARICFSQSKAPDTFTRCQFW